MKGKTAWETPQKTVFGRKFFDIDPFLTIFSRIESPVSPLFNEAKIVKNGALDNFLERRQVDQKSHRKNSSKMDPQVGPQNPCQNLVSQKNVHFSKHCTIPPESYFGIHDIRLDHCQYEILDRIDHHRHTLIISDETCP